MIPTCIMLHCPFSWPATILIYPQDILFRTTEHWQYWTLPSQRRLATDGSTFQPATTTCNDWAADEGIQAVYLLASMNKGRQIYQYSTIIRSQFECEVSLTLIGSIAQLASGTVDCQIRAW